MKTHEILDNVKIRRKGVAIVDRDEGILLVAGKSKKFMLPGGGADKGETREQAANRELCEEASMIALRSKPLFKVKGKVWTDFRGRLRQNHTKVFFVLALGKPAPDNEIKYIEFWKPGSDLDVSQGSMRIIEEYLKIKNYRFQELLGK